MKITLRPLCLQRVRWFPAAYRLHMEDFSFEPKVSDSTYDGHVLQSFVCGLFGHILCRYTICVTDMSRVCLPCGKASSPFPQEVPNHSLSRGNSLSSSTWRALPFQLQPGLQTEHQSSQIPASGVDTGERTS